MTFSIPTATRWSASSITARVVAATSHTRLTRRPALVSCGRRVHTMPESLATSIAQTRSITNSWSASRISSGFLITTLLSVLMRE